MRFKTCEDIQEEINDIDAQIKKLHTKIELLDIRYTITKEFNACELTNDQLMLCFERADGFKYRTYVIACEILLKVRNHFHDYQNIEEMREDANRYKNA